MKITLKYVAIFIEEEGYLFSLLAPALYLLEKIMQPELLWSAAQIIVMYEGLSLLETCFQAFFLAITQFVAHNQPPDMFVMNLEAKGDPATKLPEVVAWLLCKFQHLMKMQDSSAPLLVMGCSWPVDIVRGSAPHFAFYLKPGSQILRPREGAPVHTQLAEHNTIDIKLLG